MILLQNLIKKIIDFLNNSSEIIVPIEVANKLSTEGFNPFQKNIIITDGGNGTHIFNGKNKKTIPALDINPIDNNGAGDVFRGAYVWGLLQKWDILERVKFANKVAGLQCFRKGNLPAVPNKLDLL